MMYKKLAAVLLGIGMAFTLNAHSFSKSDEQIITLAKQYQSQSEYLAEAQANKDCFGYLSTGAEFLSYVPDSMEIERTLAKIMAKHARDYIHTAALSNCQNTAEIKVLDENLKNLLLDF